MELNFYQKFNNMDLQPKHKFVKSHYQSRWTGVVLDSKRRHKMEPLILVLVVKDANGNTPKKRIVKILSEYWTNPAPAQDISHINKDWFNLKDLMHQFKNRGFYTE